MKFSILLFLLVLLSSCATVFNRKSYQMNVCSIQDNSSLAVYDTVYQLPAKIKVRRSINDLPVTLKTDNSEKQFILKASPNRTSVFGNLGFLYLAPVPYLVDHYTDKRYYYGQNIVLDINDTIQTINKGFVAAFSHRIYDYFQDPYPGKKGQINVVLGGPFQNHLYLDNAFVKQDYNFFGGAGVGFEYFYTDKSYVKLSVSHAHKLILKGWRETDYDEPSTTSIELTNNYGYKRFTFGYGINYSINDLKHAVIDSISEAPMNKWSGTHYRTQSFGISLNSHFRLHKNLFLGVNYRPNFMQIKPKSDFKYEHLVSVEFLIKLRVKK